MKVHLTIKRFFAVAGLLCMPAVLDAQVFETKDGLVEFVSVSPLETFVGRSGKLVGSVDLKLNVVDFYIDLSTISTGVKLRDEHLRTNYLETARFPFAEFYGRFDEKTDILVVARAAIRDTQQVIVKGQFKIHGISKDLEVPGKLFIRDNVINVEASFPIMLNEFKIKVPQIMSMKVAQEQKVTVKAVLRKP